MRKYSAGTRKVKEKRKRLAEEALAAEKRYEEQAYAEEQQRRFEAEQAYAARQAYEDQMYKAQEAERAHSAYRKSLAKRVVMEDLQKTRKKTNLSHIGFFRKINHHFKSTACKYLPIDKRDWCQKHEKYMIDRKNREKANAEEAAQDRFIPIQQQVSSEYF